MRKFLCAIAALLSVVPAVHAADYDYLVFETADGGTQSVAVESLVMTFEDGMLVARNGSTELSYPVADLSAMYFASVPTSVGTAVASSGSDDVVVYSISGVCLGRYGSVAQAKSSLAGGVYIMKSGGSTVKVIVK